MRKAPDQSDQQRDLAQRQLADRLPEIELRGQPEAVDGTVTVLPEVHFVEVTPGSRSLP